MRLYPGTLTTVLLLAFAGMLPAQQPAPDLILSNGKIITVDERFRIAQAVAVKGDRIVAVGTNQEMAQLAGPNTRRIDLMGKAVIPGLIDNHMHLLRAATTWTREIRFDGVGSRPTSSLMGKDSFIAVKLRLAVKLHRSLLSQKKLIALDLLEAPLCHLWHLGLKIMRR